MTVALDLGRETTDFRVAHPSSRAAETIGVRGGRRPSKARSTFRLTSAALGDELLLSRALRRTSGFGAVEHLTGGTRALTVDDGLERGAALRSSSEPGLSRGASILADPIYDSLVGVRAGTGTRLGRILDLSRRATDGVVPGPTGLATKLVAQDFAIRAGTSSVTLSARRALAGLGAALDHMEKVSRRAERSIPARVSTYQAVDLGGTSRTTSTIRLQAFYSAPRGLEMMAKNRGQESYSRPSPQEAACWAHDPSLFLPNGQVYPPLSSQVGCEPKSQTNNQYRARRWIL
jgi:hypothetical protein